MFEIKNPATGKQIEVAENDFEETMDWEQATRACFELGNGWRLPTKSELELMITELHKNGKGNFKDSVYWSSSEDENFENYYYAYFINYRLRTLDPETHVCSVRAVRDLIIQ